MTIVLARLLEPSDFGALAILAIFIGISDLLIEGGFVQSLIRKNNISNKDYSTVFTFCVLLSLIIYSLLFSTSATIAAFFNQPKIAPMIKVAAIIVVFHSFSIVHNAILRRALKFKLIAIIQIVSTFISGFTAIILAYLGYGAWSLVVHLIVKAFLMATLLGFYSAWKPSVGFYYPVFVENFRFGYKILLGNSISVLTDNMYNLIIGKLYSADTLGLFYQAKKIAYTLHKTIGKIFNDVSFPVLSGLQNQPDKLSSYYLKFLGSAAFLSFPAMMILVIIAEPLFSLLLTDKWVDSVPYFQLLCFGGMIKPLNLITGHIAIIEGRSDLFLKVVTFYKISLILALIVTASFGVKMMIIGAMTIVLLMFVINLFINRGLIGLSFYCQIKKVFNPLLTSVVSAFFVLWFGYLVDIQWVLIALQATGFVFVYLIVNHLLRTAELFQMISLIKERLNLLL